MSTVACGATKLEGRFMIKRFTEKQSKFIEYQACGLQNLWGRPKTKYVTKKAKESKDLMNIRLYLRI